MKHFVLISGGKDSTATLLKLLEQNTEVEGLFCDTGWEHPYTYQYIKELEKFTNVKIHWVKNEEKSMLDIVEKYLPTDRYRTCTMYLKETPTRHFLRQFKPEEVILYSGVRKDESSARSKRYKGITADGLYDSKYSIKSQIVKECYPIIDWTTEQVKLYIKEQGFYLNPLYSLGFNRVGCFPCICSSTSDIERCYSFEEGYNNLNQLYQVIKEQKERIDNEANNYKKIINLIEGKEE